jgi:DNA uptake protein ComE-like DNA-binding protein
MTRRRFLLPFALLLALFAFAPPSIAQTSKAKPVATKTALLDINSTWKADLIALPGIGEVYSQKIIDGRPYARKDQLMSKKIIPQATYDKIKDSIIAKQATK